MVSVIVFGGWFGSGNIGDDAILIGLKRILKQSIPGIEITSLSTDPEYTEKTCGVRSIKLRSPRSLLRLTESEGNRSYIRAFREADACVVSGGIPIYDYDHLSRGIHLGLPQILYKKLVCFGIGAKPIRSGKGRRLIGLLLRDASLISTRDRPSAHLLRSIGVRQDIRVTGDSSLFMEASSVDRALDILSEEGVDASREMVAICPRMLSTDYRLHYHEEIVDEEIDYMRLTLSRTADHMVNEGYEVVFIPMHSAEPDNDLSEIREIKERMRSRGSKTLRSPLKPQEAKAVLGRMSLVIGLRLHSLIFAASEGVPIVSLDYDSKIRGFMDLAGSSEFLCSRYSSPKTLINECETALAEIKELKLRLVKSCDEMGIRIIEEAERVREALERANGVLEEAG